MQWHENEMAQAHDPQELQLHDWQVAMQGSVLNDTDLLGEWLKPNGVDRQTRLDIYSNAYSARLREALECNYPAVYQLLGDDDFSVMAKCYLQNHPSEHASIRWFGAQLADFLALNTPYNRLPVLAELARFEWALRHTVDAADAELVSVDDLQAIPPEQWNELRFVLHPSVSLLTMSWNVIPIWQALTADKEPPAPEQETMHWLVYRQQDLMSVWRSVNDIELVVVKAITADKSFADICEQTAQSLGNVETAPALVAGALRGFVENGLLTRRVMPIQANVES